MAILAAMQGDVDFCHRVGGEDLKQAAGSQFGQALFKLQDGQGAL